MLYDLLSLHDIVVRLEECTALTRTQLKEGLAQIFLSLRNTKNEILRDIHSILKLK